MKEQNTDIELKLIEYYEGKLEGTEYEEVKAWISSSEENHRIARRIHSLLLAIEIHKVNKDINTEKTLKKIKARKIPKRKPMYWLEWGQRVAVILLLPMISIIIWQQYKIQKSESTVEIMEVRTNPGMTTKLNLPDGTYVCLNSNSTLSYPSRFTEETRSVKLTGEAYFEVAQNAKQKFIVSMPDHSAIEVYGTHFNVEAYPDDRNITTTLTEGKIGFIYKEGGTTRLTKLEPGQKLIYNTSTNNLSRHRTSGISELSWTEGKIIFENTSLTEALHMLGKRFNVDFIVKDPSLNKNRFTGTFTTQHLEKILKYFEISSRIRWRYLNDTDVHQEKIRIEICQM